MSNTSSLVQAAAQLIERCRSEKELSIAEIAAALGYRSPNSVERIIKGSAGDAACRKFLNSCTTAFPDLIDKADYDKISLSHPKCFWAKLLFGQPTSHAEGIQLSSVDGAVLGSIGHYYASMRLSRLNVLLLNSLPYHPEKDLLDLLLLPEATIEHCVTTLWKNEMLTDYALLPLLFHSRYHFDQYVGDASMPCGLLRADFMLVDYHHNGQKHLDMLIFSGPHKAVMLPLPQSASPEQLGLGFILSNRRPIGYRKDTEFRHDYLRYLEWCASLESIGSIHQIKEDIGLEQIPMPILSRALREGIENPADVAHQLMATVSDLAKISSDRWHAWHQHQREHVQVMRLSSLWRFVRTGVMSDHFWGFRPFSPSERHIILEELKHALATRKYRLYFLPERYWQGFGEITCYGKTHLSIINQSTDYNLSDSHQEALITDARLIASFQRFFDDDLLPNCVADASVLDEMQAELNNMPGKTE